VKCLRDTCNCKPNGCDVLLLQTKSFQ